jgi:peptidylprolyl isomerase
MSEAKTGDKVKVHYSGKLADGTEFDTSANQEPLEFTVGAGEVIAGFEEAVVGMNPGDTKTATINADEAYGDYDDELILEVERDQFPPEITPEVGQRLQLHQPDGEVFGAVVTAVDDQTVTLDANHPLAGQDLTFEIELVEIV